MENELSEARDYARLLGTGVTSLNRIKVYFCGQPEAGKTTLSRALARISTKMSDEKAPLKMRTRGIDIMTVVAEDGLEYSFWDFAGQADYHLHHDMFIYIDAAIFVLLIDMRKSLAERFDHAKYWLRYIVTQCPPERLPSVLMIASHADEASSPEDEDYGHEIHLGILMSDLVEIFGSAVNFVRPDFIMLDCRSSSTQQHDSIRSELSKAHKLHHAEVGSEAPVICKQIIDVLAPLRLNRTHYMTWPLFCNALSSITTDVGLLHLASRYLHQIGDVYYSETGPLKDIVIIDLPWLCHEVLGWLFCPLDMLTAHELLRMIKFRRLAELGGISKKDIPITHSFAGTSMQTLDVLEAFELCMAYDFQGERAYVFPGLLRTKLSPGVWNKTTSFDCHTGLSFTCSSEATMIPSGFFQRVQILLVDAKVCTTRIEEVMWQNGVISRFEDALVHVRLAADGRSIIAHFRGTQDHKKELRRLMQRVVQKIHEACKFSAGLKFTVGYCSSKDMAEYIEEPYIFDQEQVFDIRSRGKSVICTIGGHTESIVDLLAFESEGEGLTARCNPECSHLTLQ